MVSLKMHLTKENVREFITHYILFKSKARVAIVAVYFVLIAGMLIFGTVSFLIYKIPALLLVMIAALVLMICYAAVFAVIIRKTADKLLKSDDTGNTLSVEVTNENLTFLKSGVPYGEFGWEQAEEINMSKNFAYVFFKENALVLLEFSQITSGSLQELMEILNLKKSENEQKRKLRKK